MEARVNFMVKFKLKDRMEKQDMYRSRVLLSGYRVKKKLGEGTRPICYIAIVENGRLLRTTIGSVNNWLVFNETVNCGANVNTECVVLACRVSDLDTFLHWHGH